MTLRKTAAGLVALAFLALPASAPAANKWNIEHEQAATFSAKVVDVLCELSGECAEGCGGGQRQLGLLREDGSLLLAVKGNTLFAGAVKDLLPFCGQSVEVDGLLIDDPLMPLYFVQAVRAGPDQAWQNAVRFEQEWAERYPDLGPPWWIRDPTVQEYLDRDGILGIPGLEP